MSPILLARLSARRRETRRAVVESCNGRFRYRDLSGVWRCNTVKAWRVSESDYYDALSLVQKGF